MKQKSRQLAEGAATAALYIALTALTRPVAFGPLQLRLSEALTVLPVFSAGTVWGLGTGCFLSSLLMGAALPDLIFGTAATLLGAFGTRLLKKYRFLPVLPPILANLLILPPVFARAYGMDKAIGLLALEIGASECLSAGAGGLLLAGLCRKYRQHIFGDQDHA